MKYPFVYIDVDDTLLDFPAAETYSFTQTMKDLDLQLPADAFLLYQDINHGIWKEHEQGLISIDDLTSERFVRFFHKLGITSPAEYAGTRFLDHLGESAVLLPEAWDTLVALRELGVRVYLATNGYPDVQRSRLRLCGMEALLHGVCISGEIGFKKPDTQFFDILHRMAGFPNPREVLMVGDSLSSDILGGLRAGLDTCWYNPEQLPLPQEHQPLHTIGRLSELLKIVQG